MNDDYIKKKIQSDGSIEVKLNVDIGVFKKGDTGIIDGGPMETGFWEILVEGNPKSRRCWAKLGEFEEVV